AHTVRRERVSVVAGPGALHECTPSHRRSNVTGEGKAPAVRAELAYSRLPRGGAGGKRRNANDDTLAVRRNGHRTDGTVAITAARDRRVRGHTPPIVLEAEGLRAHPVRDVENLVAEGFAREEARPGVREESTGRIRVGVIGTGRVRHERGRWAKEEAPCAGVRGRGPGGRGRGCRGRGGVHWNGGRRGDDRDAGSGRTSASARARLTNARGRGGRRSGSRN